MLFYSSKTTITVGPDDETVTLQMLLLLGWLCSRKDVKKITSALRLVSTYSFMPRPFHKF